VEEGKSMLEKLINYYDTMQKMSNDNGGYVVVFNIEKEEVIKGAYEFEKGMFSIRSITPNRKAIHWKYDPKNEI
jgi:hypothetical protein